MGDLCRDRKQRLQILTLTDLPSWNRVCLCTLALKRVLVCRLEWLTLLPLIPDLKQISHLIVGFDLHDVPPPSYAKPVAAFYD